MEFCYTPKANCTYGESFCPLSNLCKDLKLTPVKERADDMTEQPERYDEASVEIQTLEPLQTWTEKVPEPHDRTHAATVYALELDRFQDNLDRKLTQIQDSGAQVQDIQFDGGRGHFAALIIYKGGTSC